VAPGGTVFGIVVTSETIERAAQRLGAAAGPGAKLFVRSSSEG
jgi:hypothetical protein